MTAQAPTFFGDKPRNLILTPELVTELERLTGQGIGGFARRLMSGDFKLLDLHHVLRLALIGGGTSPEEASALIAAYVSPRPVLESFAVAVEVIDRLMTGAPSTEPDTTEEAEA